MNMDIRLAAPEDAGWITDIYAPIVEETVISFELTPPSVSEMAERIQTTLETFPWLAAEENGQPLGYAYASSHRARAAYQWSCDVSVYVAPVARRRNVGQRLYIELLEVLKRQGFHNAFAGIALPNVPSVTLHERLGFEHLGTYRNVGYKLDAWHDVGWWQKRLSNVSGDLSAPSKPVSD
ncbi:MAG: N-acetyltransferase [Hyphomonas sp.]|nr:N-acetyltransferase [Hyphomonas sp.]